MYVIYFGLVIGSGLVDIACWFVGGLGGLVAVLGDFDCWRFVCFVGLLAPYGGLLCLILVLLVVLCLIVMWLRCCGLGLAVISEFVGVLFGYYCCLWLFMLCWWLFNALF